LLFLAALVATGTVVSNKSGVGIQSSAWRDERSEDEPMRRVDSRCLRGALPPVDLRAVCLVRAIVRVSRNGDGEEVRFDWWGVVCGG
jgi:hypothetical protein